MGLLALSLAALGVVFGDIGTSPLYTLQVAGETAPTPDDLLGILSLIVWGLTIVVAIKYIGFVMRADNRGEGGILALLALIPDKAKSQHGITWILLLVVIGAALLYGDGIITPAISVLSAIEGLEVAAPGAIPRWAIVLITLVILIGLFAVQHKGTGTIGKAFGPVMIVWFVTIGFLGGIQIIRHPAILAAVDPRHAISYFTRHGLDGFPILGVVILCLTGGEALYADMGHFGARPIRVSWFSLVMPALLLCYLGQGAMILAGDCDYSNPFYALVPQGVLTYALVGVATLATIIASQALISGVFSLTQQAVQLGLFPRVKIDHTSAESEGQIYVPAMNWGLMIACCLLVVVFQESSKLAAAYGIAVSGTMAITSIAFFEVTRKHWKWPLWKSLPLLVLFLAFDIPFFVANLGKFLEGGFVPILVGAGFFVVMVVWRVGQRALRAYMLARAEPVEKFLATVDSRVVARVPGTAVFLTSEPSRAPVVLEHHVRRIQALHQYVVLLHLKLEHEPYRCHGDKHEVEIAELGNGFWRVTAHYGYLDKIDIPAMLRSAREQHALPCEFADATYYIGRERFLAGHGGELGTVTESIYSFLSRNAASPTTYMAIPTEQVIELGTQIDL
nr:KUP/HAK/KT family potassium transporter [Kofleriaceae bacterium]